METATSFDAEQFLALGAAGIAIFLLAFVLIFAIMTVALKLSIKWIGNRNPSFLACFGWMFAMMFLNLFILVVSVEVFGQFGGLLATPITWAATIYMMSTAGDCGLLRGFGIWITQSFLSGVGAFIILLGLSIPFAILGAGVQSAEGNLQAQFDEIDQLIKETEDLESGRSNVPESTPVGFPAGESSNPWMTGGEREESDRSIIDVASDEPSSPDSPAPRPPQSYSVDPPRQSPPHGAAPATLRPSRLAPDGSTLNPFFQQ